jgi:hypothetical protein
VDGGPKFSLKETIWNTYINEGRRRRLKSNSERTLLPSGIASSILINGSSLQTVPFLSEETGTESVKC